MSLLLLLAGCIVEFPPFPETLDSTGVTEETGATPATGDTARTTGDTSGPTGDTAAGTPGWTTSATCDGPLGASVFAQVPPMVSVNVDGTVARWPDPLDPAVVAVEPGPENLVLIRGDGSQEVLADTEALENPIAVLTSAWDGTTGYLAAHDIQDVAVWRLDGSIVGKASNPCRTPADISNDLFMAPFIGTNPDMQVLLGCREGGASTALSFTTLDAMTGGVDPKLPSAMPAVTFGAVGSGDIAAHLRNMARRSDGSIWLADDGDDPKSRYKGDYQRAVLLPPSAQPYGVPGLPVTEVLSSAYLRSPVAPAMRVDTADVDGDGLDDLLVAFTAEGEGGELWIRTRQEDLGTGVFGRDDMDYVIQPPMTHRLPGPFAVLRHQDGRALVLASVTGKTESLHWIHELPPLASSGPVVLRADEVASTSIELGTLGKKIPPFTYDMTHAGDLDGDGCDDVVLHIVDDYAGLGQGTAHILSGM